METAVPEKQNHSLLGSKEPTLLCNQVKFWVRGLSDYPTYEDQHSCPDSRVKSSHLSLIAFNYSQPHLPVPVSETVCGLLLARSFMFIVAVRVPLALGENFTLMVQCDLAGTLLS
jgi:hypothetical protein